MLIAEQALEQSVQALVIWETTTLMWRNCNAMTYVKEVLFPTDVTPTVTYFSFIILYPWWIDHMTKQSEGTVYLKYAKAVFVIHVYRYKEQHKEKSSVVSSNTLPSFKVCSNLSLIFPRHDCLSSVAIWWCVMCPGDSCYSYIIVPCLPIDTTSLSLQDFCLIDTRTDFYGTVTSHERASGRLKSPQIN